MSKMKQNIKTAFYIVLLLLVSSILILPGLYFSNYTAPTLNVKTQNLDSVYLNSLDLSGNDELEEDTIFNFEKNLVISQGHQLMYQLLSDSKIPAKDLFASDFEIVSYGQNGQVFSIPWSIWKSILQKNDLSYSIDNSVQEKMDPQKVNLMIHMGNNSSDIYEVIKVAFRMSKDKLPLVAKISLYQKVSKAGSKLVLTDDPKDARMQSFIYYWLGKLENKQTNQIEFKQLLSDEFALNFFTSRQLDDPRFVVKWHSEVLSPLSKIHFTPSNIQIEKVKNKPVTIDFLLQMQAINGEGDYLDFNSSQIWEVDENNTSTYPKIISIKEHQKPDW